jgi:hypothetical protein
MLTRVLLGWKREDVPTFDVTGRRPRLVIDALTSIETEPSPLLEAIRLYLERAR